MMPKRAIFDQKTAPLSAQNDAKTMLDLPTEKSVAYDRFEDNFPPQRTTPTPFFHFEMGQKFADNYLLL